MDGGLGIVGSSVRSFHKACNDNRRRQGVCCLVRSVPLPNTLILPGSNESISSVCIILYYWKRPVEIQQGIISFTSILPYVRPFRTSLPSF
jgi:hypothetical protein